MKSAKHVCINCGAKEFELVSGVPIPALNCEFYGPLKRTMAVAKVGDSFFTTKRDTRIARAAKIIGIKVTTRREGKGYRVWRVA